MLYELFLKNIRGKFSSQFLYTNRSLIRFSLQLARRTTASKVALHSVAALKFY